MSTLLMESVLITIIGGGGGPFTYTEFTAAEVVDDSPDIALGTGVTIRRGAKKTIGVDLLTEQAFADLRPFMDSRDPITVQFTRIGGTNKDVYTPGLFTVTPILSNIPDTTAVWVAPAGTALPPDGTGWIDQGALLSGSAGEFSVNAPDDDIGRPLYLSAMLEHSLQLPFGGYTALKVLEKARTLVDVSLVHPDGAFTLYKSVYVEVRYHPNLTPDGHSFTELRIFNTLQSFNDLVTFPVGAEDHFYGARLRFVGFAYAESTIHTATPSLPA